MKIRKYQKNGGFENQTTIVLEGLHEANDLVKQAIGKGDFWPKNFEDFFSIARANKNYKSYWQSGYWSIGDADTFRKQTSDTLKLCLDQIENGDPKVEGQINALTEDFVERAKEIEPSLTLDAAIRPHEDGDLWDAGKIAESSPLSFFEKEKQWRPKTGHGDGAFRIVINTDVPWHANPTSQCAALMALVLLLQRSAPVEIWIQQGWLGDNEADGITLFKIFEGSQLQARNIWFWIGSPYKDSPYSWTVNRMLMRKDNCVSGAVEIPCDLYVYGSYMPHIQEKEQFSTWVAQTSRGLLFDEELPENWTGYQTSL